MLIWIDMDAASIKGVTYDFISGAVPDIALGDLTRAAAVVLARDASAGAGRQNLSAIDTGLEGVGLRVAGVKLVGHGERASGEDGEDGEGEELHFERVFGSLEWLKCLVS